MHYDALLAIAPHREPVHPGRAQSPPGMNRLATFARRWPRRSRRIGAPPGPARRGQVAGIVWSKNRHRMGSLLVWIRTTIALTFVVASLSAFWMLPVSNGYRPGAILMVDGRSTAC